MQASMQIDLRDLQVRYRDYLNSDNPPYFIVKMLIFFLTNNCTQTNKFIRFDVDIVMAKPSLYLLDA